MFENKQDTSLFRDAWITTDNYLKTKEKVEGRYALEDQEEALKILASSIGSLSCSLYGVKTFHELLRKQLAFNRRCHAVVFINLLNSHNITCYKATAFYQSVLFDIPFLDWHFYLKLNFLCQWSEYFIECAQQLEPYPLTIVLMKLLEQPSDGELKYYAWHLALQTFIWKTFTLHCPSLLNLEYSPSFQFEFAVGETLPINDHIEDYVMKNGITGHLPIAFNTLLSNFSEEAEQDLNLHFIKVIFHGFKTLFRLTGCISGPEGPYMEKHSQLTSFFINCLTNKTAVIKCLAEDEKCMIDSCYLTMSWEISNKYLVFLVQNFWKDIKTPTQSLEGCRTIPSKVKDYCSEFNLVMKGKNLSHETLAGFVDSYIESSEELQKKYWLLLYNVVKYNYPFASRADEYLLGNPVIWETYDILGLQEENLSVLNSLEIQYLLADIIAKEDSSDQREKLLILFYKVISKAPLKIYNVALKNIVSKWGYCEMFKLSDFDSQLMQFQRKTVSLEEAEKCLLPLFIQSPIVILRSLIEQAVMQGPDGMEMLQVFKTIPYVCLFEEKHISPLLSELLSYFESNLTTIEAKNFLLLIKTLFEIDFDVDILHFDFFLEKCIFPNLIVDRSKFEYTTQCLTVALEVTHHSLELSFENYCALINQLGRALNFCIENGLVKFKETVLVCLSLIAKNHQWLKKFEPILKGVNEEIKNYSNQPDILSAYICGTFFKEIKEDKIKTNIKKQIKETVESKLDTFFIWCVVTQDAKYFSRGIKHFKDLSYIKILEVLPSLFWHFTKSEWLLSSSYLKECRNILKINEADYPWLLIKTPLDEYFTIRCLMDCFIIMIQDNISKDTVYICSYFSNTIMNIHSESETSLLLLVYLDMCHLVSLLKTDGSFSTLLLSIRKILLSKDFTLSSVKPADDTVEKDIIKKFIQLGLNSIPNLGN